MVVHISHMFEQVREGMDGYWRAVYSKTDDGLDDTEIRWKRDHEACMARWEERFGAEFDRVFGKAK